MNSCIGDVFYRLPDDLMTDGVDYMEQHFPAYIDTTAYARFDSLLTRERMAAQMKQNREDLTGEFGEMFPELIEMDPIGMRNVLAEQMMPLLSAGGGSYKTIEGHFFVPDSTVCIAFITPFHHPTLLIDQHWSGLDALRDAQRRDEAVPADPSRRQDQLSRYARQRLLQLNADQA